MDDDMGQVDVALGVLGDIVGPKNRLPDQHLQARVDAIGLLVDVDLRIDAEVAAGTEALVGCRAVLNAGTIHYYVVAVGARYRDPRFSECPRLTNIEHAVSVRIANVVDMI